MTQQDNGGAAIKADDVRNMMHKHIQAIADEWGAQVDWPAWDNALDSWLRSGSPYADALLSARSTK